MISGPLNEMDSALNTAPLVAAPITEASEIEPHCVTCGASLWFDPEAPIKSMCCNCYWDKCDEDRQWYIDLDKYVYYKDLLVSLTGRKWVDFLKEQSRGTD